MVEGHVGVKSRAGSTPVPGTNFFNITIMVAL
jgi:hypothetical protein